jgi:pseudomonalisin
MRIPVSRRARQAQAAALVAGLFLFCFEAPAQVRLDGNRHPLAQPEFSIGGAPGDLPMERMILVLSASQAKDSELEAFIAAQHDPNSPQFHRWLTPQEFETRFGAAQDDVGRVVAWLTSHGFTIDEIPAGRRSIVFTGNAAQVENAFRTQIHLYRVNGELHHANAADPEIPQDLAAIVAGPVSLHNFRRQHFHSEPLAVPEYSAGTTHYMSPADCARIYDINALYTAGIDGTGQTIAIVGRSNIQLSDVSTFRSRFGLPVNNPTIVLNGPDPGILSGGEEMEADLDVEWSGAVAPKAHVKFVVSQSTTTDGVDLSAQYIVSNNVAPVMSTSFGSCEIAMGSAERAFYNNLWQQAAAQGITALISSGDSGAAGCGQGNGPAVNGLCSSPYSVCVGGTQFNDVSNPSLYWSSSNTAAYGSALGYIPEVVWNESASNGGAGLWSSGGGASAYYSKPLWQAGPGVPADGKRDVPDVSLAAAGHDGYLVQMENGLYVVGGTSASSPAWAGIMALIDQKTSSTQGNANATFYPLAQQQPASFHDITAGNNTVPTVAGYVATRYYDLATGLGTPDAFVLVNHWASAVTPPLTLGVSATSLAIVLGASGTSTASTIAGGAFNSAVAMSVSGAPAGVTASLASATIGAPGTGTDVLTVTVAANATPGSYPLTITASGGGQNLQAIVTVTIPAPAFSMSTNIASLTVGPAQGGSATLTTLAMYAFNSALTLSASYQGGALPTGVNVVFTPASVPAPGSGSTNIAISTAANTPLGSYPLTITATGAGVTRAATFTLTVSSPSFALTALNANVSVAPGGTNSTALGIVPSGGFNGPVSLSASGAPAGMTISFSGANMIVQVGSSVAVGNYPITVTGASAGINPSPTVQVTVKVGRFALSSNTGTTTISRGASFTAQIGATVTNGYNVPIALTAAGAPAGFGISLSPAVISNPGAGVSLLRVTLSQSAPVGVHTLTITGTSGGAATVVTLNVIVR